MDIPENQLAFYTAGNDPSTQCQMDALKTVLSIPSFFSLTWSVVVALAAFTLYSLVWVHCAYHTGKCSVSFSLFEHCRKKPSSPQRVAARYSLRVRTTHHYHPLWARKMNVITQTKSQATKPSLMHPGGKKARHKPKAKRCVRFADDAKSWDGKRPENILLENMVLEFWTPTPQFATVQKLVDDKNATMLLVLHGLLVAAVERVKHDVHGAGVALITSGCRGEYGIMLLKKYVPRLQRLIHLVHAAHNSATTCSSPGQAHTWSMLGAMPREDGDCVTHTGC